MSDADAIVLDLDGGAMLDECLAALARQTVPFRRIVVLDNGSRVPTAARVSTGVSIIRSEQNLGFAGGVNRALSETSASWVALVNNDVVLDPRWLETLLAAA